MASEGLGQRTFFYCLDSLEENTGIFLTPITLIAFWLCFFLSLEKSKNMNVNAFKKIFINCRGELTTLYFLQVYMRAIILAFVFILPALIEDWKYEKWFCLGGAHCCFIIGSTLMNIPAGYLTTRYPTKPLIFLTTIFSLILFYLFLAIGACSLYISIPLLLSLGESLEIVSFLPTNPANRLVYKKTSSSISALSLGAASCLVGLNLVVSGMDASFFLEKGPWVSLISLWLCFFFFVVAGRLSSKPIEFSYEKIPHRITLKTLILENS